MDDGLLAGLEHGKGDSDIAAIELTAYVVDADPAWRDELALLMGRESIRFQTFSSVDDLLAAIGPECGGCLLIEWVAARNGANPASELRRRLRSRGAELPVVFFGSNPDAACVRQAFRAGALDFLDKPASADQLRAIVAEAFTAERRRLAAWRRFQQRDSLFTQLTPREREVAALAAQGHDNPLIAQRLGISHRTVEVHKSRAMKKLGTRSLAELIRLCGVATDKGTPVGSRPNYALPQSSVES